MKKLWCILILAVVVARQNHRAADRLQRDLSFPALRRFRVPESFTAHEVQVRSHRLLRPVGERTPDAREAAVAAAAREGGDDHRRPARGRCAVGARAMVPHARPRLGPPVLEDARGRRRARPGRFGGRVPGPRSRRAARVADAARGGGHPGRPRPFLQLRARRAPPGAVPLAADADHGFQRRELRDRLLGQLPVRRGSRRPEDGRPQHQVRRPRGCRRCSRPCRAGTRPRRTRWAR